MLKISLYGGTSLTPDQVQLAVSLTTHLLKNENIKLISGGFNYYKTHPENHSVDSIVLKTAKRLIPETQFANRFETWLPQNNDRKEVTRFREGFVREIAGSTQARRFNMVTNLDALITISGEGNTQTMVELALAINKPVLPIAFTGGDSSKMWATYQSDIIKRLQIPAGLQSLLRATNNGQQHIEETAKQIIDLIIAACRKTCLVLMPFAESDKPFYENCLKPAIIASGYYDLRIDRYFTAGDIPDLFQHSLAESQAVIVDITGFNPNVMYELGFVHSRKLKPLIISRQSKTSTTDQQTELPFYLRQHMVVHESNDAEGYQKITGYISRYLNNNSG